MYDPVSEYDGMVFSGHINFTSDFCYSIIALNFLLYLGEKLDYDDQVIQEIGKNTYGMRVRPI